MNNTDIIDLILNLKEMYIEEVQSLEEFLKEDNKEDDKEDESEEKEIDTNDDKDGKNENEDDDSYGNHWGVREISDEEDVSPSVRKISVDNELERSLEDFLSNYPRSTSYIGNNLDESFTLNSLFSSKSSPFDFNPNNMDTTSSSNKRQIGDVASNIETTSSSQKRKKKLKLKFPKLNVSGLEFEEKTKEKIVKLFYLFLFYFFIYFTLLINFFKIQTYFVFQKGEIKFIKEIVEKNKITLLMNDSIDFEKLRQEHYPQQENQLERNLLNFSRINREQQIQVLNRLFKSIRTDEKEIFCRITHPIFFLIDIFMKIYHFFKPEYKENKVIRVLFQDHADHTKNSCGVRNENIILCYDSSKMTQKAKEICNK